MPMGLKIGALAERAATQAETIRYYEKEGLLPTPDRSDGNYRLYGQAHVDRLMFIRRCRSLDMTLDEIRSLLKFRDAPGPDCSEVNALIDAHIGHVAERIDELQRLEKELKSLSRQCRNARSGAHCGILGELSAGRKARRKSDTRAHLARGIHHQEANRHSLSPTGSKRRAGR